MTPLAGSDELAVRGFVVTPALGQDVVAALRSSWDELGLDPEHPFIASSAHLPRSTARAVDQQLKRELVPLLQRFVPDHEPFLAAFISKGALQGGRVDFHQDWTYTDEREVDATLFWIPLTDVGPDDGALQVVEGSHRWSDGIRPSGQAAPGPEHQDRFAATATDVALGAGEAIVYRPALLHGSHPNTTDRPRPAVAIAFVPTGSPLLHFHRTGDTLDGYVIDESFYTTEPFGGRPSSTRRYPAWTSPVSDDDLRPHDATMEPV